MFAVTEGPIIENVVELAQLQIEHNLLGGRCDIAVAYRAVDLEEEKKVQEFLTTGYGCKLLQNGPCSFQFTPDHYKTMRRHAAELSWKELNNIIMGQVMALTCSGSNTFNSSKHRHSPKEREKFTMLFHHHGYHICSKTFLFLHGIGKYRLRAIKDSYLSQGMVPRIQGRTGRVPPNAFILEDIQDIVKFILQYAESNAVLLPGRVPGYKRDDIQILPSSITKKAVWKLYQNTATNLS